MQYAWYMMLMCVINEGNSYNWLFLMCLSIMSHSITPCVEIGDTVEWNRTYNVYLSHNDSACYPVWSIFKVTYIIESNFVSNCSSVA
jgi:hypothetical protein